MQAYRGHRNRCTYGPRWNYAGCKSSCTQDPQRHLSRVALSRASGYRCLLSQHSSIISETFGQTVHILLAESDARVAPGRPTFGWHLISRPPRSRVSQSGCVLLCSSAVPTALTHPSVTLSDRIIRISQRIAGDAGIDVLRDAELD